MSSCCNSCAVNKPCESGCPTKDEHPESKRKKASKEVRKLKTKLLR